MKCGCGECKECLNKELLKQIGLVNIINDLPHKVKVKFDNGKEYRGIIKYNKDKEIVLSDYTREDSLCDLLDYIVSVKGE